MDERPFPPAEPIRFGDEEERLAATRRRMRRRREAKAGMGVAVVAVVAAVVALLLVPSSGDDKVNVAVGSACDSAGACTTAPAALPVGTTSTAAASTSTSTIPAVTTTTAVVPVTPASTTSTVAATTTTTVAATTTTLTTTPAGVTSGTVTGPDGNPVAGAYIIGLTNLGVARTDANGHYSMACVRQKLVGATWLMSVLAPTPGPSGGYATGKDTTDYQFPPTDAGPGYVFSGGASDVSAAATVTCNGKPVDFHLPAGGTLDITWVTSATATSATDPPIDNLYLPGLGTQGGLETQPLSATGHQVATRLGSGTVRIDGVSTSFSCAGTGVGGGGAIWTVPVHAGQTTSVTCTTQ